LFSFKISTKARENLHLGAAGMPFIKIMTGADDVKRFKRTSISAEAVQKSKIDERIEQM
jgi:hypothetical protein